MSSGASTLIRANNGHVETTIFANVPVTHTLFSSVVRRYTNYAIVVAELEKVGHLGQHSTSEQKWNPSNFGDVCGSLRLFLGLPGIASTNSASGRGNDAYWCQSVGYAIIKEAKMYVGNQVMMRANHRNLYDAYQLTCPDAEAPLDVNIGRYQCESQLKQASAGNQILGVYLGFSNLRPKRPDRAWKIVSLWQVPTEIGVTLHPLINVIVNVGALTTVPYLKGTSTTMASSDVSVRMYGTFFILDDQEREHLASEPMVHEIIQNMTFEYTSTEAAGTQLTLNPVFNHACRIIKTGFIPTAYTDGSTYSPCGVGLKNYFDYCGSHGGESLYALDLKLNSQSTINPDLPPIEQRHHMWTTVYGKKPYGMLYVFPFSMRLDWDDLNHSTNLTGFDKLSLVCKKNSGDSGTYFAEAEVVNVLLTKKGQGGVPFGGGA